MAAPSPLHLAAASVFFQKMQLAIAGFGSEERGAVLRIVLDREKDRLQGGDHTGVRIVSYLSGPS